MLQQAAIHTYSASIGADKAIRVNKKGSIGGVAKELVVLINNNDFDSLICGRESIDYNGGRSRNGCRNIKSNYKRMYFT